MEKDDKLYDFSKDMNANSRLYIIDYLKGFSILTIVLMHLLQQYITSLPYILNKIVSIGGTGVHIFFVCSGFGLYLSYLNEPCTFKDFIKKRFVKIYIPYILIVFVSFLLPWMYLLEDRFVALLSHVFLFKMFFEKYEGSFGGHFWFVSTIIQFYLFFIVLCKIKKKVGKYFLFLCTITSIFWWIIIYSWGFCDLRIWSSFFLQYLWEFALGMCLAEYVRGGKKIIINKYVLIICTIVGMGLQSVMALNGHGLDVFNDIPALMGYGSFAILLYNIPIIRKIGIKLSLISYEWFLIHILVFSSVFYFIHSEEIFIQVGVGILAFIGSIFCALAYKLFLGKWLNKKRRM